MPRVMRVFHMSAGDCGACAAEVWAAVERSPRLTWAPTPQAADVVALTGSITAPTRAAFAATYDSALQERLPLVVVGRCAIDGHPFAKGGIAGLPEIKTRRKVDGCPPLTDLVEEALLDAARRPKLIET